VGQVGWVSSDWFDLPLATGLCLFIAFISLFMNKINVYMYMYVHINDFFIVKMFYKNFYYFCCVF